MDPFHVVRLAGDAVDRCRQRVQQDTTGHRGRSGDSLYGARRTLHTGASFLTDKQRARLEALFAVEEHIEVEATWGIYQRIVAAYREPGVLAAESTDRPRYRARGDRPARNDQRRDLLHERLLHTAAIVAPPDALPPDHSHPGDTGHVVQDATAPAAADSEHTAPRTPRRRRRSRDRHHHHVVVAFDPLDMDPVQAKQQVAAGTRAGSRARVSAPRTMVRHVEVLGRSSSWRY